MFDYKNYRLEIKVIYTLYYNVYTVCTYILVILFSSNK